MPRRKYSKNQGVTAKLGCGSGSVLGEESTEVGETSAGSSVGSRPSRLRGKGQVEGGLVGITWNRTYETEWLDPKAGVQAVIQKIRGEPGNSDMPLGEADPLSLPPS